MDYLEYVSKHGFKPIRVGDPEPPKEPKPRCHVEGCERVVYKSVLCRKHWKEVPIDVRVKRMMDAQLAQQASKIYTDQTILGLAEDMES
jgi:hypothetical protein